MKTVRLTMAQALVRFLENQYIEVDGEQSRFVRGVFIIPGHGNVVGLGQALSQEAKHLEIWHGQNEQGMAQAAVAFAKQMKRKQICVATSSVGPGAANMVTACGTATANNIPLLVLPGDVYACRQPDPVLQQVEQTNNLSISTNDAFKAVCRYWDRIVRPEQLMSAMISAFRVLTDPANTGAVCIAMPQDVEGEAYDYPESFFKKRVWRLERRPATEAALADAAEVIKKAKRPILVCGGGVRYSEAHEEFRAFAEATGIPFGETQAGKSAIEWTHPLNLGGLGVTGCSAANDIAKKADVVIGVGTRYTDFTTASKWLFKDTCKFVNINVSEFQALKMDAVPVVADAKDALPRLLAKLEGYKAPYTTEVSAAREKWAKELERLDHITFEDKKSWKPIINDANAYRAIGNATSPGTKAFALAGNIRHTGLIEVPMGTTLREIIFDIGGGIKDGKKFKAVQIGGPSGGCLTEEHLDLPLDYDSLKHVGAIMGSGGLVVMDEDTCMAEVARFFMKFTQKESCGKCIPCREGTKRMLEALERIVGNEGSEEDIELLEELSDTISHTALCGLGQSACKPVQSTLRYFREDYKRHVRDKFCPLCNGKPKVLQIDPEKCKGCSLCARNCPVEAITGEVKKPFVIDTEKCIRCNACVKNCKFGAIREV